MADRGGARLPSVRQELASRGRAQRLGGLLRAIRILEMTPIPGPESSRNDPAEILAPCLLGRWQAVCLRCPAADESTLGQLVPATTSSATADCPGTPCFREALRLPS